MNSESSLEMINQQSVSQPVSAKIGWIMLLGASALLIFAGISWYVMLPQMALENIAAYAKVDPGVFVQGNPSASDVITMIAQGYGAGYFALGLLALLVALEGYRHGTHWAWMLMWVLAAAYAAIAGIFFLAGEAYALTFAILIIAAVVVVGLLLSHKGLAP